MFHVCTSREAEHETLLSIIYIFHTLNTEAKFSKWSLGGLNCPLNELHTKGELKGKTWQW